MVGDPTVLRHRLIDLLIPHVEIAERVHGRPVFGFAWMTLAYSSIAPPSRPWRSNVSTFLAVSSRLAAILP